MTSTHWRPEQRPSRSRAVLGWLCAAILILIVVSLLAYALAPVIYDWVAR
jgi:hypothetical protein